MDRRTFCVAAVGGAVSLAGCGDSSPGARTTTADPDPTVIDHVVADQPIRPTTDQDGLDAWGRYVASADAAASVFGADEQFVTATEFEAGERLVFVEAYAPQTCYRMVLDGARVDDQGRVALDVRTERTAPEDQACGEAMTPVAVLVRLRFDPDGPAAETVRAVVDDGEETITLDAMA